MQRLYYQVAIYHTTFFLLNYIFKNVHIKMIIHLSHLLKIVIFSKTNLTYPSLQLT